MHTTAMEKFRANVLQVREESGYVQEAFAQHLQMDRAYYGRIERGQQHLNLRSLFILCAQMGVEPAKLLAGITVEDCESFRDQQ